MIQRDGDGRHYSVGVRLRRLAENLLVEQHRARRPPRGAAPSGRRSGRGCNITAFSGSEVLYLDRVETIAPLRFLPTPAHACRRTAPPAASSSSPDEPGPTAPPARPCAARALHQQNADHAGALDEEIETVKRQGYALDDEEFLPG